MVELGGEISSVEVGHGGRDDVVLGFADDGRGSPAPAGAGLTGLAERVQRLGGDLRTTGDGGFRLTARLPLAVPAEVERVAAR